ncbi:20200_t:CDS:2, partial [Racocetra persica]
EIIEIASSHPNLLSLSFEGKGPEGGKITNLSIKKIAELCPKLQYFNISERENITDESICILLQLCPNLQELILEQCNITDTTINTIINLRHNLQKLNIIYCDQAVDNLLAIRLGWDTSLNLM